MGKRNFGYQVYEPVEETQGEPDYGEFYHYLKKRNGMSLASFFLPEDLDDIFDRALQDVDVLAVPDLSSPRSCPQSRRERPSFCQWHP